SSDLGRLRLAVQGDVPSAGRSGTLSGDSTTKALLDLFRKLFHGLFGDHTAFTSSIKAGTMSSANSASGSSVNRLNRRNAVSRLFVSAFVEDSTIEVMDYRAAQDKSSMKSRHETSTCCSGFESS